MTEITEQITYEHENLANINIHQCVICPQNYIPYIYRNTLSVRAESPTELIKSYAKPYILYPYTEDLDYESKMKDLPKVFHDVEPSTTDQYNDDLAEHQYLSKKPLSFLIVGKPEIGETQLAQLLANHWKCIYISPDTVVKEEVLSNTRAGKCIKYNLEAGRSIGPEIILRLVEKRIRSQSVQHRGCVLTGFPLLKNDLFEEDPVSTESAIFTAQEIFEELLPRKSDIPQPSLAGESSVREDASHLAEEDKLEEELEIEDDKEDEIKDEESKTNEKMKKEDKIVDKPEVRLSQDMDVGPSKSGIIAHTESFHILRGATEQLEFIQKLVGTPLLILYIMCSNLDVVGKRSTYRFNILTQKELPFPPLIISKRSEELIEMFEEELLEEKEADGGTLKYQVKLPTHLRKHVSAQIRQYKCYVHRALENQITRHNPEYFIKLDGRLPALKMFDSVMAKLKTLGCQPVLLPERIKEEKQNFDELPPDAQPINLNEIEPENAFPSLRQRLILSPMYKFQLSNWEFKCPVAMKEGRILKGKSEFTLKFLNKLYFLSSEDALIKFYRNPRLYLLPVSPVTAKRMWIIGPDYSGKSIVAKCFSYLYKCKILEHSEIEKMYIKKKEIEYIEKLRSVAIAEGISQLNDNRQKERKLLMEKWNKDAKALIKKALTYDEMNSKIEEEDGDNEEKIDNRLAYETELNNELLETNLPLLSQVSQLEILFKTPKRLSEYIPVALQTPIEPATVFDPYVIDYVENVIANSIIPSIELTIHDKIDMYKIAIQEIEDDYFDIFQKRGGWIIDGMSLDLDILIGLYPNYIADDIICLMDQDSQHTFLIDKYKMKDFDTFKEFKKFFEEINKPNVDIEYSVSSSHSKIKFIQSIVSELEDLAIVSVESEITMESIDKEKIEHYVNHINNFNENWEKVKTYLSKNNIFPFEINVETKSVTDLLKEVVLLIENKYRKTASVMTEAERTQERSDFIDPLSIDLGDEGALAEGDQDISVDFFAQNRRFGHTNMYCPFAFIRYFVLWKGKEQNAVLFEQNVYLLSSQQALNEFLVDPRMFLKPHPPENFPPPRVCIIGVPGNGKTTLSKQLSQNFALHYINFDKLILNILNLPTIQNIEHTYRTENKTDPVILNHLNELNMLRDYIENDTPLSNNIIKNILEPLWFQEPYKDVGFVLVNFPRRPSDIEVMIANHFIPDIVIELHASEAQSTERIMNSRFQEYRAEIAEKKRLKDLENEKKYMEWEEERRDRVRIMAQQKQEERRMQAIEQAVQNRKLMPTPVESETIIDEEQEETQSQMLAEEDWFVYDEIMEMEDLAQINKILDEQFPAPVFQDIWESEDETKSRITALNQVDFATDIQYLDKIRSALQEENIDCTIVATDNISLEKVFYEVLRITDIFKFRNKSLFERVYKVTVDLAERLLEQGYYFISKFGRTCPVQIYENINPIQMYFPGIRKKNLFALIWKRYIYFIYGENSCSKFMSDPLKYVLNKNYNFPLIPPRIAIIGLPRSGKSIIAERLKNEFSMKLISRGKAINYIRKQIPECHLAKNMEIVLRRGWSLTQEMVAKCIESATFDPRSISQGYVLDGFPTTKDEMNHLRNVGIVPYIFVDVQITVKKMNEFSKSELTNLPVPAISYQLIQYWYREWKRYAQDFREYITKEYQNIYEVQNNDSKWHLWDQAQNIIFTKMKKFQKYIIEKDYEIVLNISSLCISPDEFFIRQSVFLTYCILCYYFDDYLTEGGKYPDRNCLFQYLQEYFYICERHQQEFVNNPVDYLPPVNEKLLPGNLPRINYNRNISSSYEDGLCIVTFWDNQPKYVLVNGFIEYSVLYKGYYYLLCSEACMKKFLATPYIYYNKIIHYKPKPVDLSELKTLPVLGYLEQLAARIIIDAVIDVEVKRPFMPGLNIVQSAAVQIALFLKLHNPNTPKEIRPLFQEAKERIDEQKAKLKEYICFFKGRLNPFINFVDICKTEEIGEEMHEKYIESDIRKWLASGVSEAEGEM